MSVERFRVSENVYRFALAGLLSTVLVLAWTRDEPGARPNPAVDAAGQAIAPSSSEMPPVRTVYLPDVVAHFEAQEPESTDNSAGFYATDEASVHMHIIGKGQMCPLHIHRKTWEATVVVNGEAEIRALFARDGVRERSELVGQAGTLVSTSAYCAHEWINRSPHKQGNLVFAFPSFDANMFLREDDPRILQGPPPFVARPEEALADFLAGAAQFEQRPLPILSGRMSQLLLKGETVLPAKPEVDSVLYVLAGRGVLTQGEPRPVLAQTVAVFSRRAAVKLVAETPMAMLLFEPPTMFKPGPAPAGKP